MAEPFVPDAPTETVAWAPAGDPAAEASIRVCMALLEALAHGDGDALNDLVGPQAELTVPSELPFGGAYRGPDGYLRCRAAALAAEDPDGDGPRAEYHEFYAVGDVVFVSGVLYGRTRNGVDYDAPLAELHTLRDGRVERSRSYLDAAPILLALEGRWWTPPSRYALPEPVLTVTAAPVPSDGRRRSPDPRVLDRERDVPERHHLVAVQRHPLGLQVVRVADADDALLVDVVLLDGGEGIPDLAPVQPRGRRRTSLSSAGSGSEKLKTPFDA